MNALVLAIAGVLVMVGIALIVLSVVLARKPAASKEPASVTPPPVTGRDLSFIDQPPQADMGSALSQSVAPPADDEPTEETSGMELSTQNDTGGSTRLDKED